MLGGREEIGAMVRNIRPRDFGLHSLVHRGAHQDSQLGGIGRRDWERVCVDLDTPAQPVYDTRQVDEIHY